MFLHGRCFNVAFWGSSAGWTEKFFSPLLQNYVKAVHSRKFYALCAGADWQVRYLLAPYILIFEYSSHW